MQCLWLGFFKDRTEPSQDVQQETSDFLQQPFMPISAAGALRDSKGTRAGMMMIFEAETLAAAQALVASSPFLRAGLYEEHHLLQFDNEVG